MKSLKFLLVGTALCVSFAAFSQADTTKKDTTTQKTDTTKKKPTSLNESATSESATIVTNTKDQQATVTQPATTSATTNPSTTPENATGNSAASSVTSSTPKPNFGRYYIPVLGSYTATATTTDNKSITITADESNPGKIWIDGLTGTKFYALLKAVPGTYKIPAQKQEDNTVAEGTVMYDESNKQINLCMGCGFNEQAPAVTDAVATATPEVSKSKKDQHVTKVKAIPVVTFTGTKADQGTVSILQ
ncbi:MAG: hypothetical protein ABIN89_24340 [Chitinophagaceae bacterium]